MVSARRTGLSFWALAALASACGSTLGTPPCSDGTCGTQVSVRGTYGFGVNRKLDLLLVLDDTPAMAPYLDRLATGLAQMGPLLIPGAAQPVDLHVGFVRAGGCDASTLAGACGVDPPEQFLRSEWCNTMTNDSRAFADAFTCLGDFGAQNCGPAQPLAAAVQAVADPAGAGWEGFLRPEAYLMIVAVAAQDDASAAAGAPSPVLDLVRRLKDVKKDDPSRVLVSVIGPGDCGAGDAPGPRFSEFVGEFGANGLYVGLCSGQLADVLGSITEMINSSLLPPCLVNVRDTDLQAPGIQAQCTVVENFFQFDQSLVSQTLPSCDVSQPPCWSPAYATCPDGRAGTRFGIIDSSGRCLEGGGNFTIECLSCADTNDPACALQ